MQSKKLAFESASSEDFGRIGPRDSIVCWKRFPVIEGENIMRHAGILSLIFALCSFASLNAGTSLSRAAISGNVSQVKACLDAGEDINEIDRWGLTPLIWAVYYKSLPVVQYLLDHKANPNIQASYAYKSIPQKSTALIVAAYYGLDTHVSLLLKYGANTELTDYNNKTAMDYAKTYNFTTIVAMLSKTKAAPASPAEKPNTPPKAEPSTTAGRTATANDQPITNQDVLDMLLGGEDDAVVINKIKKAPKEALDVSLKTLAKLREMGVPKAVIQAMIHRSGQ